MTHEEFLATRKPPKEIAETAFNHLCVYDGEGDPGNLVPTAERVKEFLDHFTSIALTRMIGASE